MPNNVIENIMPSTKIAMYAGICTSFINIESIAAKDPLILPSAVITAKIMANAPHTGINNATTANNA